MDESGKDFKLLSTFFLLSLALSNKVSASSDLRHPCNSPCLLISTPTRILALDYGNQSSFAVISNLSNANGYYVDVHYKLGYLFWSDRTQRKIKRSNMDGTNITVIHNDTDCVGLAVEWNLMRLYWTENPKKTISVSDLEGNNRNIVLSTTDYPRGIAVDPQQGLMFWATERKIEKSNLDGTQRDIIVSSNLSRAHSITVDRKRKRVFWVDFSNDQIESVNYNGSNRVLLSRIQGVINLFGIAFTSSFLFVGEWQGNTVFKVNASNGTVISSVQFASSASSGSRGIYGYDSTLQPPVVLITCPVLPAPSNGVKLGCPRNIMYYGTECHFLCKYGYAGSGSEARRCQRNGTWTGQEFACHTITCPGLPSPRNGTRLGCSGNATEFYDTVCQFGCNNGYVGSGSHIRRCQENETWSGEEFICQRICEYLQLPPNVRTNGSCNRLPGIACHFTCERGFNLIGSAIRWCDKDGFWTGTQPRCDVVTCPMLSLPTSGIFVGCNTNTTEMLYGTECSFSCKEGSVATGSMGRRCTENGNWTGTDLECTGIRSGNTWNHENSK